jgi:hypothetical protein
MAVRIVPARNPDHIPEHTLWRMRKGEKSAEARTRIVPLGDGVPELRIYMSSTAKIEPQHLLWSMVMRDGRDVGELAQMKQREFEVRGWKMEPAADDASGATN